MAKFQVCGYMIVDAKNEDEALEIADQGDWITGGVIPLDDEEEEEDGAP